MDSPSTVLWYLDLGPSKVHSFFEIGGIGMTTNALRPVSWRFNLLKTSEAAIQLNAHPNSIRRWADFGLLNCYRIGPRGHRRFKTEDLEKFLAGYGSHDSSVNLTTV